MIDDQKMELLTDHEKNVVDFLRKGEPIVGKKITQNAVITYTESRIQERMIAV